jgi:tartrate dehydrogenase/decarboxylase/D-malate dehydrogenase
MAGLEIAVIRGDGIGVEVVEEGLKVLRAVGRERNIVLEFSEFPWGSDYYFENARMMPSDALDTLAEFDAIYLGAVGHPEIQDNVTLRGLLLPIRKSFDQYVGERPSVLYPGITSPLRDRTPGDIDLVVIRENTEGEYAAVGGFQYLDTPDEMAFQTGVFTRRGCERVMVYAFELARKRRKQMKVTSVTKSNALGFSMVLWDRAFESVASRYPDIETESLMADAACMDFIRRPEEFDVLVASNLFGDIITDVAAIVTGTMGLAAGGNIDPERRYPSMFEPVHGSAPDIMGKGIANPLAAILSGAMMLEHLGQTEAADLVENAVLGVLYDGETLTPDLGGTSSTSQVGDAVVNALGRG